ncbi:hypothetical protein LSAT2_015084 [Lamellibrachia satsuma]|nr:hypothetical protein LSAT2_015084 [Lamellibrachia satsuma]
MVAITNSRKCTGWYPYKRLLRKTLNVSLRNHMTNHELYGSLARITTIVRLRRLRLAGHVLGHDEFCDDKDLAEYS